MTSVTIEPDRGKKAVGRCLVEAAVATLIEEKSICHPSKPGGACWTNDRSFPSPTSQRDVSFVRVGALRLRISRQGQGPPLLLLGGLGNSLGVWDNLVAELPDFETIAVDAPGTGFSSTPALPLSMAELAEVYANLVRSLQLEKVSVLGLSFGGAVAQQLAYQSPELVRGLVLCGTGPGIGGLPGAPAALQELASPARYYSAARSRRVTPLIYGGRFAREPERFNREVQQRWPRPHRSTATTVSSPPSWAGAACPGWAASRRRHSSWPGTRIPCIRSRTRRY